jgi:hypothetical protein
MAKSRKSRVMTGQHHEPPKLVGRGLRRECRWSGRMQSTGPTLDTETTVSDAKDCGGSYLCLLVKRIPSLD